MPENEFEKKVSSEMQDLKFKPSEKTWLRVEERIRRKRKRRVFIIIFLLAGLGLLGYWQWENVFTNKQTTVADTEAIPEKKPPTKENAPSTIPANSEEANNNKENTSANNKIDQPKNKENISETSRVETKENQNQLSKQTEQRIKKQGSKTKNITPGTPKPENEKKDLKIAADEPADTKTPKNDATVSGITEKKTPVKNSNLTDKGDSLKTDVAEIGPIKVDSVVQPIIEPAIKKIDSALNSDGERKATGIAIPDSTKKKTELLKDSAVKKDHAVKKWKWGFELTPGISSLTEEIFSLDMSKMADAFANPSAGSGNPSPQQPAQPSLNSSGFSFQVGVLAKNQITKRSSISLGLRYGYYSDKIRVGRDSVFNRTVSNSAFDAAGSFYRASNTYRDHTNSYHFLELPVNYQLRLNKNQQKPFTWNFGFTIGRMIATNAVMYDTAFGGIYYKNTSQLNKTQFSLSTGLSWTIFSKRGVEWSVGPFADVHVNSFLNNPFEKKKYLVFAGLRSAVFFNSKK